VQQRVEEQHEPRSAGVDHPALGEHREQFGGAAERVGGLGPGGIEGLDERPAAVGSRRSRLGGLAHHGEDRALDRSHHRLVGGTRCRRQRSSERGGVEDAGSADDRGEPAHDLGQDDPRVATGPHERTVPDGVTHRLEIRRVVLAAASVDGPELGHDRLEGERHVGAGVAVGHRVDVEAVDVRLVGPQRVAVLAHRVAQGDGVESVEHGHDGREYRLVGPDPAGLSR
jgi:hypothetical protein